jgi:hypothetical protein
MRLAYPVAALLLLIGLGVSVPGKADDAPLFHVKEATVACADAISVRNLTNPSEPRRSDAAWYKSTFESGRCVSVTPKSPWRFVSRENDVAMMDYAGTVGPPGSYYFLVAQLADPAGNHPGDTQGVPTAGAVPAGPAAATSNETALAPNAPPPALASTPADVAAGPAWGITNILLLAVALLLAGICGFLVGRRGPSKSP